MSTQACRGFRKETQINQTPVLIAARNEAENIGRLLNALPADITQPIVIANGCHDGTADVARGYGAVALELDAPGKLPAIQYGLRFLGQRALHRTILMTDADAIPLLPRRWPRYLSNRMQETVGTGQSAVAAGPVLAYGGVSRSSNVLRSSRRLLRQIQFLAGDVEQKVWCGANMAVRLSYQDELEALLEMPHYWPGEDLAIVDTLRKQGAIMLQSLSPSAAVMQEARYAPTVLASRRIPKHLRHDVIVASYVRRGAQGSTPYERTPSADIAWQDTATEGSALLP